MGDLREEFQEKKEEFNTIDNKLKAKGSWSDRFKSLTSFQKFIVMGAGLIVFSCLAALVSLAF